MTTSYHSVVSERPNRGRPEFMLNGGSAPRNSSNTVAVESQGSSGPRILLVDDDLHLGKFLCRELGKRQFVVDLCQDGLAACESLLDSSYDLIILDMNLPKMDGMSVITQVRQNQMQLPIMVLTAQSGTKPLISALEQGADDWISKPFSLLELVARMHGLLRRGQGRLLPAVPSQTLTLNREEHWVKRGERRIDLTVREFTLLEYLVNNEGKALSRKTLMEEVWSVPYDASTNIVDVYMKYLRDKIDRDGESKLIRTVRGVGYVFSNP